jgi:hypothetical protein
MRGEVSYSERSAAIEQFQSVPSPVYSRDGYRNNAAPQCPSVFQDELWSHGPKLALTHKISLVCTVFNECFIANALIEAD